jgi:hypothetical protein
MTCPAKVYQLALEISALDDRFVLQNQPVSWLNRLNLV